VGRQPRETWLQVVLLISLLVFHTPVAFPQIASSRLEGTIIDASGAPLADAQVQVTNLSTNATLSTTTSPSGFFLLATLPPGAYRLRVSHAGFTELLSDLSLAVGEQRSLRLRMSPGTGSSRVQLGDQGQPQSANSSVGGVADSSTVRDLPSNGRDWTQAATLQAGVTSVRTQPDASNTNSGRGQRGFGAQISVSGGRPQQNNYILNGVSINDYANSAPGSVLGLDLGADAVEQFAVVTTNYPAEFGRSSGGVINAITRSGTNQFHGSVYEFLRNSALDARNYFDSTKPPFRRNQFGAAVGGPIRKDRTFFFANYEGLRQSLGVTHVDTVPSPNARAGVLSTGNVQVDPQATRYLAFFPLPNRELLGAGDSGIFAFSGQQITPENYLTARVDHKLSEQDALSGAYAFDGAQTTQPDQFDVRTNEIQTRRNVFSLQERHVFSPKLLNFFRFGVNRVVARIGLTPEALNPLAADTSYGFFPGLTVGSINVVGLTNFTGGLGAASPYKFHWTSIQAYDDATSTNSRGSLRIGIAMERMRDNMLANTDPNGVFTFHSLSDFLTNRPFSLSIAVPGNQSTRDLRQTVLVAYVQDDFRVNQKLTANFGLRYETATLPTEVGGRLATLRRLTDTTPHLGDPYFNNPTHFNFEPRVGISWDPFAKGRIVVRAGFGIFDVLPLPYEFELVSLFASPFSLDATPTNLPPGTFPNAELILANTTSTFRNVYVQPNPGRNYVNQWNANVEVQTSQNSSVRVAYVGSRGIHQPFRVDDANLVLPTLTSAGYLWPSPPGSGTKLNPAVGRLDGLFWVGDSYYDALQVQGKANLLNSLNVQASYTWGKSIDTGSATIAGDQFSNSISSLSWFDLRLARGPSDFNLAQNLSLHFTYEVPSGSAWYTRNWRFNGTYQASTGVPFTVVLGGDPLGSKSTDPFDVPNLLKTSNCAHPVNPGNAVAYVRLVCFAFPNPSTLRGNLGRNSLNGPGLSNLDVSLFKDNYLKRISETFNFQTRIEAFNVLNHTNFSPPLDHRALFDQTGNPISGAGLIDSTATPSRQIQIGLKVIW
jgi:hypothetical protein